MVVSGMDHHIIQFQFFGDVGPEIFNEGAHEPNGIGGDNSQALFAVVEHCGDCF